MLIGMSLSMIPPCIVDLVARWCFFATLTPSTIAMRRSGITRVISPSLPMSLPESTITRSPLRSFSFSAMSEHLRREGDDAHEAAVAQLPTDRAEDARAAGLQLLIDEHRGVLVEADVAAVRAASLLLRAYDDALHDLALLHGSTGHGVLHGGDEDVADARVATPRAPEDLDAQDLACTRVVGDLESRLLLDHGLPRPLEHFDDAPTLLARQRTGLGDANAVALVGVVRLVVGVEAPRLLQRLAVAPVAHPVDDRDDDGLVHLVGDHEAFPRLPGVGTRALLGGRRWFAHVVAPSASSISRSRSSVLQRAMSFFRTSIREKSSSCPVASWKRRLNSSSRDSRSLLASSMSLSWRSSDDFVIGVTPPRCAPRSAS